MWWVNKFGNVSGPYSEEQIRKLVQSNRLTRLQKISQDRVSWVRLDESVFWHRSRNRPEEMELPELTVPTLRTSTLPSVAAAEATEVEEVPQKSLDPVPVGEKQEVNVIYPGVNDLNAVVNHRVAGNVPVVIVQPVVPQPTQSSVSEAGGSKSRLAYILLCLFFGYLGIHNFYAGRVSSGVAQMLITIFTGWLIIPLVVLFVWNVIEMCCVTTDGSGRKML